jgi:hypothetical protein
MEIPKYWVVKSDGSTVYDQLIHYISEKAGTTFVNVKGGFYGYVDYYTYNGWNANTDYNKLDNNPELISLQFFNEYILNNKSYNPKTNGQKPEQRQGQPVKVQRPVGTVSRGEGFTGESIQGRSCKAAITVRYLSYQAINSDNEY